MSMLLIREGLASLNVAVIIRFISPFLQSHFLLMARPIMFSAGNLTSCKRQTEHIGLISLRQEHTFRYLKKIHTLVSLKNEIK